MDEKSDRKELERRLEQAKRAAALGNDPITAERLQKLVKELEEQLRLSGRSTLSIGPMSMDLVVRRMRPWDKPCN